MREAARGSLPRSSPGLRLARATAEELSRYPETYAVILVGSLAQGRAASRSDIDLAVVAPPEGEVRYEQRRVEGRSVDLHYYPTSWLPTEERSLLDLKVLRETSRIAHGAVLFSRWEGLEAARARARSAVLSPLEAAALTTRVEEGLIAAAVDSPSEALWALQASLFALGIFALSTHPTRYQKPKWMLRDLDAAGFGGLADLLRAATSGRVRAPRSAARLLERTHGALLEGCALLGLPPMTRDPDAPFEYTFLCRTFADARVLLEEGDSSGAVLTASVALRFMDTLLAQRGDPLAGQPREAWRARALCEIFPRSALRWASLERVLAAVLREADDVMSRYRGQLEARRGVP